MGVNISMYTVFCGWSCLILQYDAHEEFTSLLPESNIVLYVYRNGVKKSGLYCAICNMLEGIDWYREVNVYHSVRQLQLRKPEAIKSKVNKNFWYLKLLILIEYSMWSILMFCHPYISRYSNIVPLNYSMISLYHYMWRCVLGWSKRSKYCVCTEKRIDKMYLSGPLDWWSKLIIQYMLNIYRFSMSTAIKWPWITWTRVMYMRTRALLRRKRRESPSMPTLEWHGPPWKWIP